MEALNQSPEPLRCLLCLVRALALISRSALSSMSNHAMRGQRRVAFDEPRYARIVGPRAATRQMWIGTGLWYPGTGNRAARDANGRIANSEYRVTEARCVCVGKRAVTGV
eukprot:7379350-Prymnesium_polylepis.1